MTCIRFDEDPLSLEVVGPVTLYFTDPPPPRGSFAKAYVWWRIRLGNRRVANNMRFIARATLRQGRRKAFDSLAFGRRTPSRDLLLFEGFVKGEDIEAVTIVSQSVCSG